MSTPIVGDFVICTNRRPSTLQPWLSAVKVGMILAPDDNPQAWNGHNSEADHLASTGMLKVCYIDVNGTPETPEYDPATTLIKTERTKSFWIASAADALATFDTAAHAYQCVYSMGRTSGRALRPHWLIQLDELRINFPPRYGDEPGAVFLGYHDEPHRSYQSDCWAFYEEIPPRVLVKNSREREVGWPVTQRQNPLTEAQYRFQTLRRMREEG